MTQPPEMACRQCLHPLNTIGDPPKYVHPFAAGQDGHPPVPVQVTTLHTVHRTCDFCGDRCPLWSLTGSNLAAVSERDNHTYIQNMGETWASCAPYQRLAAVKNVPALVERAVTGLGVAKHRHSHASIAELHAAFLSTLQPGRVLITTTAWPPTPIHAKDLPKVRDRLARFYRGSDGLPTDTGQPELRGHLARGLDRAGLFWIDDEFTELAEHAANQLPAATINRDDMPAQDGLLIWARPITDRHVVAASWTVEYDRWHLTCYRNIGGDLDATNLQHIREQVGWLAPMTTTTVATNGLLNENDPAAPLVGTWLLIAQKVAEAVPVDIDPGLRKSYARAKRTLPDVRIVRIRARPEQHKAAGTTSSERVYKGRFWVSAHWRNQAYGPGRTLRRPIYVGAFLKGPEELPIVATSTVGTAPSLVDS